MDGRAKNECEEGNFDSIEDPEIDEKVKQWLAWDKNKNNRELLKTLVAQKDTTGLRARMLGRMSFGTAGMRGTMDVGFNRFNDLVIIQTTQGMARYMRRVCSSLSDHGVVIGYDGRHNSHRFAELAASVFVHGGVKVYLFSQIVPTPYVAYAVTRLGCDAGIMITASHNPKQDNGYKVYWNNGAQILSPHDKGICETVLETLEPWHHVWDTDSLCSSPLLVDPFQEIKEKYTADALSFCFYRELNQKCPVKMTYTPFHGVGKFYTPDLLEKFGFQHENIVPVKDQLEPDPDFPTVPNPNPEEGRHVLALAIKAADEFSSSFILANDPDADRLQIAEKQRNGEWRIFTGNEMGGLLAWWVWHGWQKLNPGKSGKDVYMINSAVSSTIVKSIAQKEGFQYEETLTGFKWMGNRAQELRATGKTVLLTWEESIGYMSGKTLDKDGVVAAAMFAEFVSFLASRDRNLAEHLQFLFYTYGYHLCRNSYFVCREPEKTKRIFNRVRALTNEKYPERINGQRVKFVRDLTLGFDNSQPDNVPFLPTNPSNEMLTFTLENGSVVTLRASGTEPKIKYYIELKTSPGVDSKDLPNIEAELDRLEKWVTWELIQPQVHGLTTQIH